tara:strand:- start:131 stop:460 length:330 start_codon:yes stop_codon:yes gene_type:complete
MVATHQLVVATALIDQATAAVHAAIPVGMEYTLCIPDDDHIDAGLLEDSNISRRGHTPRWYSHHPPTAEEGLDLSLEIVLRHVSLTVDTPVTEALNAWQSVDRVGQMNP